MKMAVYHQNFMLAVRREMGWPAFRPANDAIAFTSGRAMDFETGHELARITQMLRKDVIYSSWKNPTAKAPLGFTIAFRQVLLVDIIDRVLPYAAGETAPLAFLSTRGDEMFMVDHRGSLAKVSGKPTNVARGRKIAMARIFAAAAGMSDELLENNRFLPTGGEWIEPEAPLETIVQFR